MLRKQFSKLFQTRPMHIVMLTSLGHFINDFTQSTLYALYPMLKKDFGLGYSQVGLITLIYLFSASIFQPLFGWIADRNPMRYFIVSSGFFSLIGMVFIANTNTFALLLLGAALVGLGASIFHPEASRIVYVHSENRRSYCQSLLQLGGNVGNAIGPLCVAFFFSPLGRWSVNFTLLILIFGLYCVGFVAHHQRMQGSTDANASTADAVKVKAFYPRRVVIRNMLILIFMLFCEYFYFGSFTSFYTFYLIQSFSTSVLVSQLALSVFLGAFATGTLLGNYTIPYLGLKPMICLSILGVAPFSLLLPHVGLSMTIALTIPIGFMLASAMPAMMIYAQDLMPGHVGLIGGLFFGLAFGFGGVGAALLGYVADLYGVSSVFLLCSFLPLLGIVGLFLTKNA